MENVLPKNYSMKHPDHITFEIEGRTYQSWPKVEQRRKRLMFANHKPDSIVKCYDFDTKELLDELPLNVLFNEVEN